MADAGIYPATSMPDRDWWAALFPDPDGLMRQMGVVPGMIVADLCCGDGYFTASIAAITGGQVHAVDLDPALIARARAELAARGEKALAWHTADALDLPALLPEPVDYVLIANTLHGAPDKHGLAATAASVLRPSGKLGVLNWRKLPREDSIVLGEARGPATELRMMPSDTAAILTGVGFHPVTVIDIPPFHYGVIAAIDRAARIQPRQATDDLPS